MRFKLFSIAVITATLVTVGVGALVYREVKRERALRRQQAIHKLAEAKITLIEGWTTKDIASYLDKQQLVSADAFLRAEKNTDLSLVPSLSFLAGHSLEGFLFPDTYLIAKPASSEAIIEKLLENFVRRLNQINPAFPYNSRYIVPGYEQLTLPGETLGVQKRGASLYELVTLASIVEKETGRNVLPTDTVGQGRLAEERKVIAGIFYNRLLIGQALESDATINYITGKNDPSVSTNDLGLRSLYNTYKYAGLPPGPIANPSLASLEAVLHPTKTDYFYFFHKQPSGEAVYSRTFEEHRKKKLLYLK